MSYSVARRTREIGIRTALCARDVLTLVLGRAIALTMLGLAAGLAASFVLTPLLATLLFDVTPTDAATFTGVSVLLGGVAMVASYVPARRAWRVDPCAALRPE